ncbi:MAG: hypothetical protein NHF96_00520 [Candidatus Shikimatogenerans bostrichidophilus]|nr:MAG: hypothetical protein NHF96_00520 [Candidatus Shikimatogenerans bostrichidophilus]
MNNNNLIYSFFLNKNINKNKIFSIIKESVLFILNNKYKKNIKIKFKKGKIKIYKKVLIANDKIKSNYKKGDYINKNITLKRKILIKIIKQIYKKIDFILNNIKYKYYKNKIGQLIKVKVKNIVNNLLILNDKYNNELYYKIDNNYINKNYFKINNYYNFLVLKVFYNKYINKIKIILSRKDKLFIKEIFKLEVPEILEGIIKIKKIIIIPDKKYKIIVYSKNKMINAIGACLGVKKSRLNNILKEFKYNKEKIDIIEYKNKKNR